MSRISVRRSWVAPSSPPDWRWPPSTRGIRTSPERIRGTYAYRRGGIVLPGDAEGKAYERQSTRARGDGGVGTRRGDRVVLPSRRRYRSRTAEAAQQFPVLQPERIRDHGHPGGVRGSDRPVFHAAGNQRT